MAVLPTILQPSLVNERISRVKVKNTTFQRAMGFQAGGPNVRQQPSRRGSYDIFDETRRVATAVHPGVEANTVARFPVGNVPFIIPRSAEKIPLPMEEIVQFRAVGGPTNQIDIGGEQYILDQERNQKQSYTNLREFQCVSMLRGSYTFTESGNAFDNTFSGGSITIDYQIPSGNKDQLDMLGAGDIIGTTWSNTAAPIVRDLLAVNQAFEQLSGTALTDIWVNSTVWGFVVTNTEVQNLGGTVNNPIRSFIRENIDGDTQGFTAVLEAAPWVTWHITDVVLNVGGTVTRLIGDNEASFTGGFGDSTIATFYECSEPVVDPVTNRMSQQFGEYFYFKMMDDPVSYELHARYNGLPTLKIPNALAYGTVIF